MNLTGMFKEWNPTSRGQISIYDHMFVDDAGTGIHAHQTHSQSSDESQNWSGMMPLNLIPTKPTVYRVILVFDSFVSLVQAEGLLVAS